VRCAALFEDRFTRPFALGRKFQFFANPCESAPITIELEDEGKHERHPLVQVPTTETGTGEFEPSATFETGHPTRCSGSDSAAPLLPIDLIRQLVAERAELPLAAVQADSRMLRDLHLNSISVGQLVSEAAKRLGLPRIVGLTDFANASVTEMARALDELKKTVAGGRPVAESRHPPGVDSWIETFSIELVAARRSTRADRLSGPSEPWQIIAPQGHPLITHLTGKLAQTSGGGVMLWLPENPTVEILGLLLQAARAVTAMKEQARFVLVQHGWGGAGFARTLHLETPGLTTCIVNVPPGLPRVVDWIIAEAAAASGYTEAHYDAQGCRREPRLKWHPPSDREERTPKFQIGPADVLLVTGGGKGIAAESALALGRRTGARLALMGRSDPAADPQLAENLARIAAAGINYCYVRADVTDGEAVRKAVAEAEGKLGPVTAFLHGAGTNTPQLISALDETTFLSTVSPKIQGARNVLAAIDPEQLRLFVTFGSIIARAGFRGEADYATANEWLTALTEQFQKEHPRCRCHALEWSVWSGVGMGERLGRIESLIQQGITPIPPDQGVKILLETLRRPPASVALVVAGRFGDTPTLKVVEPELPLLRFLERKRVYYPGVELIVDAKLSAESDPYLNDHVVQKQKLFPAVLGMEAMAQIAMALTGSTVPPTFEQLRFTRPVGVPDQNPTSIRLAALRRGPDTVEVCLRSEETDFQVDHFRAICRFSAHTDSGTSRLALAPTAFDLLALDPQKDLYQRILFHQGRFCRLRGYRLLKAKECIAEITADDSATWFGPYLPAKFLLGNPAARDAALHAIQACIPHRRILPTGIDELNIRRSETGVRFVRARERERHGDDFIYDVELTSADGEVIERWTGLHLRAVELMSSHREAGWPEALLSPYLERRFEELLHQSVRVALERDPGEKRPARTDIVILHALGKSERIWRRPDGRPVASESEGVSAAHAGHFTLAVAGADGVACDLEAIITRSESVWQDLFGADNFLLARRISREQSEGLDIAATRLWTVIECLKKAGLSAQSPLMFDSSTADGWVLFRSGGLTIASGIGTVRNEPNPLAVAVAVHSAQTADRLPSFNEATA